MEPQPDVPLQHNETSEFKDQISKSVASSKNHNASSPAESAAVSLQEVKQSLSHLQVVSCELLSDLHSKMSSIRKNSTLHTLNLNRLYENCHQLLEDEEEMKLANSRRVEDEEEHELEENLLNLVQCMESLKKKTTKEQVSNHGASLRKLSLSFKEGLDGWEPPVYLRLSKEMTHIVKPIPEEIEFDPESAHPNLSLSPDLKQVRFEPSLEIRERKKDCFEPGLYILGKPGFKSGRHYWEVDVGSKSNWIIGVVRESVERKGAWELNSANGYWVLRKQDTAFYGIGEFFVILKLETLPLRIGVCLDLFKNHLAFYDADTTGLIFHVSVCSGQRLFPFFCPGMPVCDEDWCPLTLCP
ncbi:nuclear factor 7, brain-like isoform X2 [Rana temporaria]|uniref:nuclear factor 7, brain-like isoform X2 n=1 Tax=Rana temporaria TaxID=8407 RepID=UPI001AADC3E8|nr:nuclear factor 7, brain-like isoform X2 [Rana temporaria]